MESKFNTLKIIGRAIKYFLLAVLLFIFGFMIFRLCASGDTKIAKNFLWTEKAALSYKTSPGDFKFYTIDTQKNYTDNGYFFISSVRYAENADKSISQFQLTVRWNDSTVKYLTADYNLSTSPEEPFVFVLKDDSGAVYGAARTASDKRFVYNFRRVVFDGVDISSAEHLYIEIYYSGDSAEGADPYGTVEVYSAGAGAQPYQLKKEELPK